MVERMLLLLERHAPRLVAGAARKRLLRRRWRAAYAEECSALADLEFYKRIRHPKAEMTVAAQKRWGAAHDRRQQIGWEIKSSAWGGRRKRP